ncbi:MAG TPA: metallophosphoesterase [Thermoanaerobaculia bacterium]|nr:metallophosphoesterase [Thermoanaerobaculia bacterium]
MSEEVKRVRLAAVADIHCGRNSQGEFRPLFEAMSDAADVIIIAGDLTSYGLVEEAKVLAEELSVIRRKPIMAVLGNHDVESNQQDELCKILTGAGMTILDGDAVEIQGVGFAGVKGFAGGFGRRSLEPWGEQTIKQFVRDAVDEALKLESALARLRHEPRVVIVHYAPIHATVVGEPEEIFPFLGSSRLEEPIDRYRATVAFHGHAHHGSPEGRTKGGVPVYNVAIPVMRKVNGDAPPFRLFEVEARQPEVAATT